MLISWKLFFGVDGEIISGYLIFVCCYFVVFALVSVLPFLMSKPSGVHFGMGAEVARIGLCGWRCDMTVLMSPK